MSKSSFWKKKFLGVERVVHVMMLVGGILTSLGLSYYFGERFDLSEFALSWSAYIVGFYVVLGILYKFDVGNKKSSE